MAQKCATTINFDPFLSVLTPKTRKKPQKGALVRIAGVYLSLYIVVYLMMSIAIYCDLMLYGAILAHYAIPHAFFQALS